MGEESVIFIAFITATALFLLKKKIISRMALSGVLCLFAVLAFIFYFAATVNFTSVSLENESIAGLKIGDSVKNDHRFVKSGTGVVEYKAKNMSGVKAEIDKQEKIVLLFNISSAQTVTIAKGIKINDTLQTVVEVYGKEYKELWFVEGMKLEYNIRIKKETWCLNFISMITRCT
ncbi:hypothetical protein LQ247_16490 [Bacillus sp. BS3(2021)]|uniref:hypothetical protein n=1 Tax=Bacillus TaxID=1386 RepID=UPI001E595C5A|nr:MULTISPECIES: hypothetical protein [Bacillus]MCD2370224.1 hypothetical protein [Bacillus sp. BS3(2021)]MCJ8231617.1 hypothetical protein [Bacillus paralicheniformis]